MNCALLWKVCNPSSCSSIDLRSFSALSKLSGISLVAQFVVARQGGDMLGLLVVVDHLVLDVVVAQRILQLAQVLAYAGQLDSK